MANETTSTETETATEAPVDSTESTDNFGWTLPVPGYNVGSPTWGELINSAIKTIDQKLANHRHKNQSLNKLKSIGAGHYHETVESGSVSGTVGLDLSASNLFRHTLTGDTSFEFNNPTADPAGNSFTLIVEQDSAGGHAITWPSGVEWGNGSAPGLDMSANEKHMFGFVSPDGGTTWIGVLSATGVA